MVTPQELPPGDTPPSHQPRWLTVFRAQRPLLLRGCLLFSSLTLTDTHRGLLTRPQASPSEPPTVSGLQVPAPAPSSLPKPPKSRRPCSPLLPALSTQTSSHSPRPPREQRVSTSDSTSPAPWRSSASKSGRVPYLLCRAHALLELHPLWFQTQDQFLDLPLSLMISLFFRRRLDEGPGLRGFPKYTNAEICIRAPNGFLSQDSSSSQFPTDV